MLGEYCVDGSGVDSSFFGKTGLRFKSVSVTFCVRNVKVISSPPIAGRQGRRVGDTLEGIVMTNGLGVMRCTGDINAAENLCLGRGVIKVGLLGCGKPLCV